MMSPVDVYFDIAKQPAPVPLAIAFIWNIHVLPILLNPQLNGFNNRKCGWTRIDGLR